MRLMEMKPMMKMKLLPLALAPAMIACALAPETDETAGDHESVDTADTADTAHLGSTSSALCLIPPTPPPADRQWFLSAANPSDAVYVDPPNEECEAYVINARNVEDLKVTVADAASTADKCVGTTLYVRRYSRSSAGIWTSNGVSTTTGVWTVEGCRLPSSTWSAHTPSDARIHITTKRTYTAGQFSVTLRGLPISALATVYYNPPPN
jgi:hypothetical protein